MKNAIFRLIRLAVLATVACVWIAPAATVDAQGARRIQFSRGRTGAVVKGLIKNGRGVEYLLGARAGQTLIVHITSNARNRDVVFSITGPRGEDLSDGPTTDYSGRLPSSGDWVISVGAFETKTAAFTLEVTIR